MKLVKQLALVASITAVTGCSSLGVGDSEFSCSGLPEKGPCQSARDIYEANANGGGYESHQGNTTQPRGEIVSYDKSVPMRGPVTKEERLSGDYPRTTSTHYPDTSRVDTIVRKVEDRYVAPRTPDKPVPVRTPAQVMRIWIAPWEDKTENLRVSSYVFTEIEKRKWMYDMRGVARGQTIKPLQMIKSESSEKGGRSSNDRRDTPSYEGLLPSKQGGG